MRSLLGVCMLLALSAAPAPGQPLPGGAPPARGDELAECLLRSTSEADRAVLVGWMFATLALHPAVQSVTAVSDNTRDQLNVAVAALLERLLTESCRTEARAALQNQGPQAFQASFSILGQVAAQDLFASPSVAAGMQAFTQHLDGAKLQAALQPSEE